jgi:tRNA-modifying protein YgfZ
MTVVPDRALVRMSGPDAVAHLQSMVSNDVEAIPSGGGAYALLLTPKARVISDLEVFNTPAGLVLACPPETRDDVVDVLVRARFRKKVELEPAGGAVVWGEADGALATMETPIGPYRLVEQAPAENGAGDWEVARIEAGIPRFGREFGPDTMPAEAGLIERAVSFTKGCYPGQEPIARLHYRGRPNRRLRVLEVADAQPGDEIVREGKTVGRVTSAVPGRALGYVRREVPEDAGLEIGGAEARLHLATPRP